MALGETPPGPARRRFASGEDIVVARAVLQSTCAASLKVRQEGRREAPNLNACSGETDQRELEKLACICPRPRPAAAAAAALRDPEMAMGMPSSCCGFELTLRMRLALGQHGGWEHPGCGG